MILNCCARKAPSEGKTQSSRDSREIPVTRTRFPWDTEPEKFNREPKSPQGTVPKFENKAKKPTEAEAGQKGKHHASGLDKTELALQDATSNIAKDKKSVMDAKVEMDNLRKKQTELTRSLVEKEKQASAQDADLVKNLIGSISTSHFASAMIMQVGSLSPCTGPGAPATP